MSFLARLSREANKSGAVGTTNKEGSPKSFPGAKAPGEGSFGDFSSKKSHSPVKAKPSVNMNLDFSI